MGVERLDQILLRFGYVTEPEIKKALRRQEAHGGRMGTHLVYFRFITENQLVHALSVQHGVPPFDRSEHDVSKEAVEKLPYDVAIDHLVMPIEYDAASRTLDVAVCNPGDKDMLKKVKREFGARQVNMFVAPEHRIYRLIAEHYGDKKPELAQIIDLPELFKDRDEVEGADVTREESDEAPGARRVLMVTRSKSIAYFLTPLFDREGLALEVVCEPEETARALGRAKYEQIVVAQDCVEDFTTWVRDGRVPNPEIELSAFPSVSGALLENPVPYKRILRTLMRSLQTIAELRATEAAWVPPYMLICNDAARLARSLGFRRLVVDGLQVAAYLLAPANPPATVARGIGPGELRFYDFVRSLEYARALHFPWNVHRLLSAVRALMSGETPPTDVAASQNETSLAAQILAVVWYHRVGLHGVPGPPEEVAAKTRAMLGEQVGRLANRDVIDAYIRLLERTSEDMVSGAYNQIFVVSDRVEQASQLTSRLNRAGFHTVEMSELREAQRMCARHAPVAVIIDRESFPKRILDAPRLFKTNSVVLVCALTRASEPALTLELMDAGFDDVFSEPFDLDVIADRLSKSLRGLSRKVGAKQKPGSFSATFKALSFIDLLQTLAQSVKTVHINIRKSTGETADIHLHRGRIVYGVSGTQLGEHAVYEVIRWGEDGAFTVEPEESSPEPNIFDANEAILMEGCRLLDESTI